MPLNGCGGAEGGLTEVVTNAAGSPLVVGEVVRISSDDACARSRADAAANAQGTVGVVLLPGNAGNPVTILNEGKGVVLLVAGLVGVAAGQTLWVSPTVAGRATNVKPSGPGEVELCVGIIKDASQYGIDETVVADVDTACEPEIAGLVASIQSGKVSFAGETTKAVVFPVAFPVGVEPAVALTPIDQGDATVTANLDAATTNVGFSIRMSTPYTGAVYWIACTD